MSENQKEISKLLERLELLLKKQQDFGLEINHLKKDIERIKQSNKGRLEEKSSGDQKETLNDIPETHTPKNQKTIAKIGQELNPVTNVNTKFDRSRAFPKRKSNWEKFIGENLINKVGILITIIGVFIGAKYSIENNLIGPLTRIVIGYLIGLGLIGFGIKLKAKYENYSAVLVGGALAIMYFITFAAYSFYALFPQTLTFGAMLLFTVFGVVASLNYNRQIIAHLGLVGAYAIPFLLSNDSGNALILFGYMTVINIGILVISFKRYWKPLYLVSFIFTWLIYLSWAMVSYEREIHFLLAFCVISVFFVLFYITFLSYKLLKNEKFKTSDVFMVLLNSFIFYGLGYGLLNHHETGKELLGLFTLANAFIHFMVSLIIYKRKLADRNLFFLISGLVLTFITIAIPVQLDGNWVTLLWALEAALLFWIGRSKKVSTYEHLSYPMIFLAFFSLAHDWLLGYDGLGTAKGNDSMKPFFNIMLLTSLCCSLAFGFINWVNAVYNSERKTSISQIMSIGIPAIFLVTLYASFYVEIGYYWDTLFHASKVEITNANDFSNPRFNYDLKDFSTIWLFNYSFLFLGILTWINIKKHKNRVLGIVTLILSLFLTVLFLTNGLYTLSELRENYLNQILSEYFTIGFFHIGIRYIALTFFAFLLYVVYRLIRRPFMEINFKIPFELIVHTIILWVASSELLHWMDIAGTKQVYRLGLSILWGTYALLLIALGIWKKKKYLRVAAIALFGTTLIKLFFYDIASLDTIFKTIVFVSLGVLLLIISFLYNKYKDIIGDENEK
ncbi:DUF2339 domain-containing protein [Maribacter sp. 2304DJ31-5]|uniref:DUF2339 domain-containing protein n=1 Tax=Maribacter sp. 2304DJ31-5 TaxID=3386273 RepID=UPI0039BD7A80